MVKGVEPESRPRGLTVEPEPPTTVLTAAWGERGSCHRLCLVGKCSWQRLWRSGRHDTTVFWHHSSRGHLEDVLKVLRRANTYRGRKSGPLALPWPHPQESHLCLTSSDSPMPVKPKQWLFVQQTQTEHLPNASLVSSGKQKGAQNPVVQQFPKS